MYSSVSDKETKERQLIYLLLKNKDLVARFIDSELSLDHFDKSRKLILIAIAESFEQDCLLTRKHFSKFVNKIKVPAERVSLETELDKCFLAMCQKDDYAFLVTEILEHYIKNTSTQYISQYANQIKEGKDTKEKLKKLIDNLQDLDTNLSSSQHEVIYENILEYAPVFLQYLQDVREGNIEKETKIICNIPEIDETMVTGFAKGTLTLFCSDVGGFKSTIMLNLARNIWKNGHNVLFVPLEMAREQMFVRLLSQETRIPSEKIFNPEQLSQEDVEKIQSSIEEMDKNNARLYMLEYGENTTVSAIKRQIERYIDIFNPEVIVVDYIGNLTPDKARHGRNDLEIGDMLKSLRSMGKNMDFAIVSGAQIGREALKRLRNTGSGNNTAVYSEDLRGSHEYAADADNIYAQMPNQQQPQRLLDFFVVKSRNGKKSFPDGSSKATLIVNPEINLITSQINYEMPNDEVLDSMIESFESENNGYELVGKNDTDEDKIESNDILDGNIQTDNETDYSSLGF